MKSHRLKKYKLKTITTIIILCALLLMATTYAWFSANREVSITDITAKVVASEGMQVSLDGEIWGATIEINKEILDNVIQNLSSWPNELVPVSTDGSSTSGKLNLKYGAINQDGSTLEDVATESDDTTTKYISFDLYLKNASSDENGNALMLSTGSYVKIAEDGVENTGLENSIRIGMVLYENTTDITAAIETIRALAAGTPEVVIWEPNYNRHINEVIINDRRISAADEEFTSWGLKMNAVGTIYQADTLDGNYYADDAANGITAGDTNSYLARPATIETDGEVQAQVNLKAISGNEITLASNTITKARVYIWLEGQDPDCNNTASTGKVIDIVLNLAK